MATAVTVFVSMLLFALVAVTLLRIAWRRPQPPRNDASHATGTDGGSSSATTLYCDDTRTDWSGQGGECGGGGASGGWDAGDSGGGGDGGGGGGD